MNIQKVKQFALNNYWYGENPPEKSKFRTLNHIDSEIHLISLEMPDGSRIWGIDISHWNMPTVDLIRMIDLYGLAFVIIKGCDGSLRSRYFEQHRANAKASKIPWGIYDWLYRDMNVSIEAQTNAWVAQAKEDRPPMGIFIDAEWTYFRGVQSNPTSSDLRLAHDKVKTKYSEKATTYTSKGYADSFLKGFDWSREELWIANYGVDSPNLPSGASTHSIWQFSSTLDGHKLDPEGNAELDGNYFNGTKEEFIKKYGVSTIPSPPPQPPTGDYMKEGTVVATSLKIRSGPGTTYPEKYPPLFGLKTGDKVYGDLDPVSNWFHFNEIHRVTGQTEIFDGWSSAVGWDSANPQYMTVKTLATPPPPTSTVAPVPYTYSFTIGDDVTYKKTTISGSGILEPV